MPRSLEFTDFNVGIQPFNITQPTGAYYLAYVEPEGTQDAYVAAAAVVGAPYTAHVQATDTGDISGPTIAALPWGRLILAYTRPVSFDLAGMLALVNEFGVLDPAQAQADYPSGVTTVGIYERTSDDHGATWSAETLAVAYGDTPTYTVSREGTLLRTWVVDPQIPYGPLGSPVMARPLADHFPYLRGSLQDPGDAMAGSAFDTPLPGEAFQGFGMVWTPAGLVVSATVDNVAQPDGLVGDCSLSYSGDHGRTWTRYATTQDAMTGERTAGPGIQQATNPGLTVSPNGAMLHWATRNLNTFGSIPSQAVVAQRLSPGDAIFSGGAITGDAIPIGVTTDATALVAAALDDRRGVAFVFAYEGAGRAILAHPGLGADFSRHMFSADEGATVTPFP